MKWPWRKTPTKPSIEAEATPPPAPVDPDDIEKQERIIGVPRKPYIPAAANITRSAGGGYEEIGVSGLNVRQGKVYDDYNADLMTFADRMKRYDEMRRSDTAVTTIENLLSLLLRRASWETAPGIGDTSLRGKKIAERLGQNIFNEMSHSWDDFLRLALIGPLKGLALFEMVWEEKYDGIIGWRKFADRNPITIDRWYFDKSGGVQGYKSVGYSLDDMRKRVTVDVPIEKLLLYTWRKEAGNPEGIGLLRQAWKAYNYKSAFEEFAAIRIERQALGVPVLQLPDMMDIPKSERENAAQMVARLRVNEDTGLVMDASWDFRYEWPGSADVPFEGMIERQHQYILQTLLAQFVGYSQGGDKGSFGLSADASSMFLHAEVTIADWICAGFNRYAVSPWMEYNYPDHYPRPRLVHGPIGMKDVGELGNLVRAMFDMNVLAPRSKLDAAMREAGMEGITDEDWTWMEKQRKLRNPQPAPAAAPTEKPKEEAPETKDDSEKPDETK